MILTEVPTHLSAAKMAESGGRRPLQFSAFASRVHPGFWNAFSKKKLEEMQLSEDPVPLNGQFVNRELG